MKFKLTREGVWIALTLLFIGFMIAFTVLEHGCRESFTATVSKTERVTQSNGETTSSFYLVYTDHGVYRCADSLLERKFNSSDLYGSLRDWLMDLGHDLERIS